MGIYSMTLSNMSEEREGEDYQIASQIITMGEVGTILMQTCGRDHSKYLTASMPGYLINELFDTSLHGSINTASNFAPK